MPLTIKREKLFRIGKTLFFDVRDYELRKAVEEKQSLVLLHEPTEQIMRVPLKEITHNNFKLIGMNKTKKYPASFKQENYNINPGDTYQLYSIVFDPEK